MKQLDKLKDKVKIDKHLFIFFIILLLIGVLVGSIFVTILNSTDKTLVNDYLNNFLNTIENNKIDFWLVLKNNLFNTLFLISGVWLLGISVIGLPIIVILFFSSAFTLGFTIGSILLTFKAKGLLFTLIYTVPGQIIKLLMLLLLSIYAVSFSIKLIHSIFKKKTIDFKVIMNRYLLILLITSVVSLVMVLYDTYAMPFLIKQVLSLIR